MKVAVHAHMHYADLTEKVAGYLRNIPCSYDLIISVTDPAAITAIRTLIREQVPQAHLTLLSVDNRGRDVKPFYTDAAHLLTGYDIVGHIHGKKSVFNNGATAGWLEYLLDCLMGSEDIVRNIFDQFRDEPLTGVVYPAGFCRMPYWANTWLSNRGWAADLRDRLQLSSLPESYFSYPIGNMFWARGSAIQPLLQLNLRDTDFPPEQGQNDGEIMHALERMTTVVARAHGYTNYVITPQPTQTADKPGIILSDDRHGIDFSAYKNNSLTALRRAIEESPIRVVSFDIFDTLVVRALPDPADIFDLMEPTVEKLLNRPVAFRKLRIEADGWQRQRLPAGKDVTITAIYDRIGGQLQLTADQTRELIDLELSLEKKFIRARRSVVAVMDYAYNLGKQVILVSDMYLEKEFVAGLLKDLGIVNYHELYLSSDTGLRKDTRTLFPHLLAIAGLQPRELIHIGDNEHSDLQIPGDLGIPTFHVMRPIELFRRTALGKTGFPGPENTSLFFRVSFGLMLTRVFDDPFPATDSAVNGDLTEFGYWLLGPTLLAYTKWVMEQAKKDNIDTLYFLARDGEILIRTYQTLRDHDASTVTAASVPPAAHYLEVSRRSLGLPFVTHPEQLDKLLQPEYAGGPLSELIRIRLGIDLEAWPDIDLSEYKFSDIHAHVSIPDDLAKIRPLCHHLWNHCRPQLEKEKTNALAYLGEMGLFDTGRKAVVDIGYSGTLQRILNDMSSDPLHGYYMVLYKTFDALIKKPGVHAKGLFGDRIDPYHKMLSVDRYSLFYEMILSSVRGQATGYRQTPRGNYCPEYATVDPKEKYKLEKLPVIHDGIIDYCRDVLDLLGDPGLIRWDETGLLLTPFQNFLENPTPADLEMLAGYSLDDHYCGQGILYWAPPPPPSAAAAKKDFLWKKYVPHTALWSNGAGLIPNAKRETELFNYYQQQYETLPGWFKKIGQLFKIIRGTKRIRIVLEDVGYVRNQRTKAEEIQAWYDKEYEVLPRWYKKFGQFIRQTHHT